MSLYGSRSRAGGSTGRSSSAAHSAARSHSKYVLSVPISMAGGIVLEGRELADFEKRHLLI